MRNRLFLVAAAVAMAVGVSASPVSASTNNPPHRDFAFNVVKMNGQNEIDPAGNPGAGDPDGKGTFAFVAFDSKFCYLLTVRKIDTPVASHVHMAAAGVNGGIAFFLDTPTNGVSANCITAEPDTTPNTPMVLVQSELDALIANQANFYANVHTAAFPAGAIRGQLG